MFRFVRVAALVGALLPAAASAVVLDFNNYRPANATATNRTYIPGTIVEDGFSISVGLCGPASPGSSVRNCFVTEQGYKSIDPTGAAILTFYQGQTINIARIGGGSFTFNAIDILSSYGTTPTNLDLIFTLADGTRQTVRQPLPGSSSNPARTYSFDIGLVTLVQLDPVESNAGFQFDNINVVAAAAVPEPATWAMMIAGFGLAGGAMRVRRRATVAA